MPLTMGLLKQIIYLDFYLSVFLPPLCLESIHHLSKLHSVHTRDLDSNWKTLAFNVKLFSTGCSKRHIHYLIQ